MGANATPSEPKRTTKRQRSEEEANIGYKRNIRLLLLLS